MEVFARIAIDITLLIFIVGIPAWLVLLVIKIARRNDPSQKISTAFKVVTLILIINIPLFFLATSLYLTYALSSMPMTQM